MREFAFTVPVSGVVRVDANVITITVNQAQTTVTFEPAIDKDERIALPEGTTLFDVLLDSAQRIVGSNAQRRFTAAELYHKALAQYPNLRRNTWSSHVIASAPNHPSHRHHSSKREFFDYVGEGKYKLRREYVNASRSSAEGE